MTVILTKRQATVFDAIKAGTTRLKDLPAATGCTYSEVLSAVGALKTRGAIENISKGCFRIIVGSYELSDRKVKAPAHDDLVELPDVMGIVVPDDIRKQILGAVKRGERRTKIANRLRLPKVLVNQVIIEGE